MSIVKDLLFFSPFICLLFVHIKMKFEYEEQRKFFINILSHDFKVSTLAQARGTELLKKNNASDELIQELQSSCNFILEMINTLIQIYGNSKIRLNNEMFDIEKLLLLIFTEYNLIAEDKNIDFYYKIDGPPCICTDKEYIYKLVKSLVAITICYARKNNSICCDIKTSDKKIHLFFIYKGVSLSKINNKNIFFTPVGMAIKFNLCKKIIHVLGGRLDIKRFEDNIHSISIALPIKPLTCTSKTPITTDINSQIIKV